MSIIADKRLTIPLYHGTSTLFLNGIIADGLGGKDPISEWNVIESGRKIESLSAKHLQGWKTYENQKGSFSRMLSQDSGALNWQHGQAYLSPSKSTAIRYATNKRYGSEILTYSLNLLSELVRRNIPEAIRDLYQDYPKLFDLLDLSPSPLLITVKSVKLGSLDTETDRKLEEQIDTLDGIYAESLSAFEVVSQQMNFRLTESVGIEDIEVSLINIRKWNQFGSDISIYPIIPKSI